MIHKLAIKGFNIFKILFIKKLKDKHEKMLIDSLIGEELCK